MSFPAGSYIYTGPWINWSRGVVLGSTITLSQQYGSLLTAFLGIIVTVAGAACWTVQSFLIHQHRVKKGPSDAIHCQQQVILRNSNSAGAAVWQMIQVAWAWRKLAQDSSLHSLWLALWPLCNTLLFGVAGVFSAEVTKAAGNETLILSPNCGYLLPDSSRSDLSAIMQSSASNALEANDTLTASAYSRACYGEELVGSQCYQYPKPSIPWTNRTDLPCPFGGDICKDTGGFEMDSGLIDSHDLLGINSKVSDRVHHRRVTSCSVLQTAEHSYYYNATDSGEEYVRYNYGTVTKNPTNFTYQYRLDSINGLFGYTLIPFAFLQNISKPIAELDLNDADLTLMFIAPNLVTYKSPVFDPLYRATVPYNQPGHDGRNDTLYSPDFWVSVLACADRFQFHNPANGRSTSLTSNSALIAENGFLQLNKVQSATIISLYYAIEYSKTYHNVHSRGAGSLRASDTLGSDSFQIGLPDNQWQIEVTDMFAVAMAKTQQLIIKYATGPTYFHEGLTLVRGDKDLCQRQKVRSASGYLSFSVLGVSIILIISFLLIVTAMSLDSAVGALRQHLHWDDHKRLQWAVDEKLQVQRVAFEAAGQGTWTAGTDAVPTTTTAADVLVGFGAAKPQGTSSGVLEESKSGASS